MHGKKANLIFENDDCTENKIHRKELLKVLMGIKTKPKFVILAACNSHQISEVFEEAQFEHVISTTENIEDKAILQFTSTFYQRLLKGDSTICSAFDAAK